MTGIVETLLVLWIKTKIKRYIMKRMFLGMLKSKTIGLAGIISVLTWLSQHTEVVNAFVPTNWQESAGYGIAFAIAVLRILTTKPLADK